MIRSLIQLPLVIFLLQSEAATAAKRLPGFIGHKRERYFNANRHDQVGLWDSYYKCQVRYTLASRKHRRFAKNREFSLLQTSERPLTGFSNSTIDFKNRIILTESFNYQISQIPKEEYFYDKPVNSSLLFAGHYPAYDRRANEKTDLFINYKVRKKSNNGKYFIESEVLKKSQSTFRGEYTVVARSIENESFCVLKSLSLYNEVSLKWFLHRNVVFNMSQPLSRTNSLMTRILRGYNLRAENIRDVEFLIDDFLASSNHESAKIVSIQEFFGSYIGPVKVSQVTEKDKIWNLDFRVLENETFRCGYQVVRNILRTPPEHNRMGIAERNKNLRYYPSLELQSLQDIKISKATYLGSLPGQYENFIYSGMKLENVNNGQLVKDGRGFIFYPSARYVAHMANALALGGPSRSLAPNLFLLNIDQTFPVTLGIEFNGRGGPGTESYYLCFKL